MEKEKTPVERLHDDIRKNLKESKNMEVVITDGTF